MFTTCTCNNISGGDDIPFSTVANMRMILIILGKTPTPLTYMIITSLLVDLPDPLVKHVYTLEAFEPHRKAFDSVDDEDDDDLYD